MKAPDDSPDTELCARLASSLGSISSPKAGRRPRIEPATSIEATNETVPAITPTLLCPFMPALPPASRPPALPDRSRHLWRTRRWAGAAPESDHSDASDQ